MSDVTLAWKFIQKSAAIRRARELAELRKKATPGAWHVKPGACAWYVVGQDGYVAHNIGTQQDARLIAAAPEMAALLEALVDFLELGRWMEDFLDVLVNDRRALGRGWRAEWGRDGFRLYQVPRGEPTPHMAIARFLIPYGKAPEWVRG